MKKPDQLAVDELLEGLDPELKQKLAPALESKSTGDFLTVLKFLHLQLGTAIDRIESEIAKPGKTK